MTEHAATRTPSHEYEGSEGASRPAFGRGGAAVHGPAGPCPPGLQSVPARVLRRIRPWGCATRSSNATIACGLHSGAPTAVRALITALVLRRIRPAKPSPAARRRGGCRVGAEAPPAACAPARRLRTRSWIVREARGAGGRGGGSAAWQCAHARARTAPARGRRRAGEPNLPVAGDSPRRRLSQSPATGRAAENWE